MGVWKRNVEKATKTMAANNEEEEEDENIFEQFVIPANKHQENEIISDKVKNTIDSMFWQPITYMYLTVGVLILIVIFGLSLIIYKKNRNRQKVIEKIPENCKDLWIPPSESYKNFGTLRCITPYVNPEDSSDEDNGQFSPLDSPISVTSGSIVSSVIQPSANLGAIEKKHSTSSHRRQRGSSLSSSPLESSSKASDEDDPDDIPNNNGKIWFSAKYQPEDQTLSVEVIKAKYLKGRSIFYSPRDPFVRVYLLPDETNFFQTKVKHRTFSPKFKETFTFKLDLENSAVCSLKFVIYDFDKRSVRHSLGQVTVPLAKINITTGDVVCSELDDNPQRPVYIGEILLSLCCNPFNDKFRATVVRIRNLPTKGICKQSDVFVRADLYHGRHQAKSKTSLMHPLDTNIEFQETFSFGVSGRYLDSCSVVLTVVRRVRGSSKGDTPIGRLVVGPFMFARGRALLHWQEMLCNARSSVEKWHNLCEVT